MKRPIAISFLVLACSVALVSSCHRDGDSAQGVRVVPQTEPASPRRVEIDPFAATRMLAVEASGVVSVWNIEHFSKSVKVLNIDAGALDAHFFSKESHIVTAGYDGTVCAWDLEGKLLWQSPGHRGPVRTIATRPTSERIVTGGEDGTIRVWDFGGKSVGQPIGGQEGMILSVDQTTRGDSIASMDQAGTVRIFRDKSGTAQWEVVEAFRGTGNFGQQLSSMIGRDSRWGWDHAVSFSPLGNLLAVVAFDANLRFFRLDGSVYGIVYPSPDANHVRTVTFGPDGNSVVLGTMAGNIQMIPLGEPNPPRHFFGHMGGTTSVSYSPLGDFLVSAGADDQVSIWRTNGINLGTLGRLGQAKISSMAVAANDGAIAVGDTKGGVQIWNLDGTSRTNRLEVHETAVQAMAFSARGDVITTADSKRFRVWNSELLPISEASGDEAKGLRVLQYSPVSPHFAGAAPYQPIRFWPSFGFPRPEILYGLSRVSTLDHSPDGSRVAAVDDRGSLRIWGTNGKEITDVIEAHPGVRAQAVAFVLGGNAVVTGGDDGKLALWDANGKNIVSPLAAHAGEVRSVVALGDGTIASGGSDGVVRFWSASDLKLASAISLGVAVDQMGIFKDNLWVRANRDTVYVFRNRILVATYVFSPGGLTAYTPSGKLGGEPSGSNRPVLFRGTKMISSEDECSSRSREALAAATR